MVLVLVAGCSSSSNAPLMVDASSAESGPADGASSDGPRPADGASPEEMPRVQDCTGFPMPNPASTGLPHPMSYAANADGTVTDEVTGLTWEATVDGAEYMQGDAVTHCAAKGAGWRLPTRLELVSLVDYTVSAPGPTINAVFKDTPATTFWTASAYYGDVGDDWYVGFDVGYSDYGIENQSALVRCVRAPPPTCRASRYQVNADGTVTDLASGLVWQRTLDPGSYTWGDALKYCAGLGAGWRAPSLTETQTIIDDGKEFPAVDETAFPDTPSEDFWTGTVEADGSGSAWYVDFFYGASDRDVAARQFRVRCVR
jgi:hypothetical protein